MFSYTHDKTTACKISFRQVHSPGFFFITSLGDTGGETTPRRLSFFLEFWVFSLSFEFFPWVISFSLNIYLQLKKKHTSSVSPELLHSYCTRFLRKLAPTLYTHIYWVQANILSMGKLGAWVQLPVITLAKPRKFIKSWLCLKDISLTPCRRGPGPTIPSFSGCLLCSFQNFRETSQYLVRVASMVHTKGKKGKERFDHLMLTAKAFSFTLSHLVDLGMVIAPCCSDHAIRTWAGVASTRDATSTTVGCLNSLPLASGQWPSNWNWSKLRFVFSFLKTTQVMCPSKRTSPKLWG